MTLTLTLRERERQRDRQREREREREREAELIIFDLEDDTLMPYCMYIVRHLHNLQQTGLKQRIYFQKLIKVRFEFLFIMGKKNYQKNEQTQENFVLHLS